MWSSPARKAPAHDPPQDRIPAGIRGRSPRRNPRTHSQKQIAQIASSIRYFGFVNPVLVDESNGVIAGHGRIAAAKLIGMELVPTVRLRDMSEADIRAYVIADNKLAENAGWNRDLLALEFQYLSTLEVDYDLTLTGFELPEIDISLGELNYGATADEPDPADRVPEPLAGDPVTRLGDVWHIGQHRLICGDSTRRETYERLLGPARAQMVFCDAPYNVPISGHVCGSGAVQHREFVMASGEMSSAEFTAFLSTVFRHLAAFSIDGAIHYQAMDWRHMAEMLDAGAAAYTELKNLCVWSKTNAGMGSLYRSQHELVFVYKAGTAPHINNVELGRHGRHRSNIWTYAGVNGFGANRSDLALHPTVKPLALVRDAVLDCSSRRGIVLDAFVGSGTTLIAAEQTGRRGYGIELDPIFCDVTIRRLKQVCGLAARLGPDGPDFDAVADARALQARADGAASQLEERRHERRHRRRSGRLSPASETVAVQEGPDRKPGRAAEEARHLRLRPGQTARPANDGQGRRPAAGDAGQGSRAAAALGQGAEKAGFICDRVLARVVHQIQSNPATAGATSERGGSASDETSPGRLATEAFHKLGHPPWKDRDIGSRRG